MDWWTAVGIMIAAGVIVLMFQRWFWLAVFFFSGLASCFAMLASIFHFQILAALGFFILMSVLWAVAGKVYEGYC